MVAAFGRGIAGAAVGGDPIAKGVLLPYELPGFGLFSRELPVCAHCLVLNTSRLSIYYPLGPVMERRRYRLLGTEGLFLADFLQGRVLEVERKALTSGEVT
jgi:hypothetical protein